MEITQFGNLKLVNSLDIYNFSENICTRLKKFYDSFGRMASQKKKNECAEIVEKKSKEIFFFLIACNTEHSDKMKNGILDIRDYIAWKRIMHTSFIIRETLCNKSKHSIKAQIFKEKCEGILTAVYGMASDRIKHMEKKYNSYIKGILK